MGLSQTILRNNYPNTKHKSKAQQTQQTHEVNLNERKQTIQSNTR